MTSIECPNCHHDIRITLHGSPPPAKPSPAGALTSAVMRDVQEFMRENPGRFRSNELYRSYMDGTTSGRAWIRITKAAFWAALKANGATRWRSSTDRGYEIPEIAPEQKAASAPPTVAAKQERQAYLDVVEEHQTAPPTPDPRFPFGKPTDLPFA
jgi:hypothetical protein